MEMIGGTVKFIKVLRMNEILDFFEGLVFVNEKKKKIENEFSIWKN